MPLLRLQQPCAAGRVDEARFVAAFAPNRPSRRADAGPQGASVFFGGGTPSLMQPQTRRRHSGRDRRALDGRDGRRDHARSQSDQRRGGALPRLSRGGRQPRLARRAGAERRRSQGARAHCTPSPRRWPRWRSPARYSSATPSISSMPGPARASANGAPSSSALAPRREHLSLYQLTIEPGTHVRAAARRRQARRARRRSRPRFL